MSWPDHSNPPVWKKLEEPEKEAYFRLPIPSKELDPVYHSTDWGVEDSDEDQERESRWDRKPSVQEKITSYYTNVKDVDIVVIEDESEDEMYGDVRDIHESPFA